MSWNLIKSIRAKTDLRLILPFGLSLKVGDVVSVDHKTGKLTLEGTARSLLRSEISIRQRSGNGPLDFTSQSGDDVNMRFRLAGEASTLFDGLPNSSAGVDISFGSANAWLLAVTGRSLTVLSNTNDLREHILSAYQNGVWRPDWALVNSVATVNRMTLIASRSKDTNVALDFSGDMGSADNPELSLTAHAAISAMNKEVTHSIVADPATAFFSGIRVIDSWFSNAKTGTLTRYTNDKDYVNASEEDFWEDADEMIA